MRFLTIFWQIRSLNYGVKEKEEMKLDSLPESLEGSPLWSSIEEAIGMLENVQDALEEMNGSLDSILAAMGTTA